MCDSSIISPQLYLRSYSNQSSNAISHVSRFTKFACLGLTNAQKRAEASTLCRQATANACFQQRQHHRPNNLPPLTPSHSTHIHTILATSTLFAQPPFAQLQTQLCLCQQSHTRRHNTHTDLHTRYPKRYHHHHQHLQLRHDATWAGAHRLEHQ